MNFLTAEDLSGDLVLGNLPRDGQGRPMVGGIAILRRIGKGGMGAVYYGIHPRLQVEVAIKILPFNLLEDDPKMADRFASEARLAAVLSSDHLVRVLDVNQEGRTHYLVMEYVKGESAGGMVKRVGKGLSEEQALDIVTAATRGLAVAHARGVIHRDVKPDNILIPNGELKKSKLADLGLAKPESGGQSLGTMSHVPMGTPGYMAPEQAEDARTAGPPADVFSMGATLYALLSGKSPFTGTSLLSILRETSTKDPAPLPPGVSAATKAIVARAMSKKASARHPSAAELLADLEAAREETDSNAVTKLAPQTQPTRPRPKAQAARAPARPPPKRMAPILAVGAGIVLVAAVAVAWWWSREREPAPVTPAPPAADRRQEEPKEWARVLEGLGEIAARLERLEKYLAAHPTGPHAAEAEALKSMLSHFQAGQYDRALAACEEYAKKDPQSVWAVRWRGASRYLLGDRKGAMPDLDASIARAPADVQLRGMKAKSLLELREWQRAIQEYDELIRLDPKSPEAHVFRGYAKGSIGDHEGAIADYSEELRLNPRYTWAYVYRAEEFYNHRSDFEGAIWDCSEAIQLEPGLAHAWMCRGLARRAKGDLAGARSDSNEAIRLNPKLQQAYNTRGLVSLSELKHDEAIADFTMALSLDPGYYHANSNRALAWSAKGEFARAIADCDVTIRMDPKKSTHWNIRGLVKARSGDHAAAVADYDECVRLGSTDPWVWNNRAFSRSNMGDRKGAIADYERCLQLAPVGWPQRGTVEAAMRKLKEP